mmetsp:Transcript_16284/g.34009  ORF Transcript_16284/g.34009 Transcript_16284/m.34009 type:complete len:273 (+) Transcript_16284:28-846(+)
MGICGCQAKGADYGKVGGPPPPEEPAPAPEPPVPKPVAGQQWRGLEVCSVYPLSASTKTLLVISAGSVIDFEGDAIVNAANEGCITGGGVDGAIVEAGGPELAAARLALPVLSSARETRCLTGDAKMTVGGSLKVPYCIHAVGPDYNVMIYDAAKTLQQCDALVSKAYKSALDCAREKDLSTVAFSLISASIFRGPQSLENVLAAGIAGLQSGAYPALQEVHLVAFTKAERMALEQLCGEMFPYAEGTLAAEMVNEELRPIEEEPGPIEGRA